jgi:hypothetical protein
MNVFFRHGKAGLGQIPGNVDSVPEIRIVGSFRHSIFHSNRSFEISIVTQKLSENLQP